MKNCLAIILVIIFSSGYLYAREGNTAKRGAESAFSYKSNGIRDPFVPLVDKEGRLMVVYGVITSIDDVVIEGILYDPKGGSVVALNGMVLKENDVIGNIKVKKIKEDKVILLFANNEYTLKIKE